MELSLRRGIRIERVVRRDPTKEGHDTLDVRSAKLRADGRTVFLEIPDLKPVMQLQVQYNLTANDGASLRGKIYATINRVPSSAGK